ncbi:MAG: purine-nucleoside phosphorylase [Candidatus Delongbacteria bacterium]|nr:purine-nucleoside phosphorylase [Candidatus Delongbacteria bacterium]
MNPYLDTAREAGKLLAGTQPDITVILGSGLGEFADRLDPIKTLPTTEIPGYPHSTVPGHAGRIVLGRLDEKVVLAFQGRIHFYEGYAAQAVVLPVMIARQLGCDRLLVTNAAGGINRQFSPGDLMLITDHINLMGMNPLLGVNDETLGPRFPDMSAPYDPAWIESASTIGHELGIALQRGILMGLSGPSYETPAEIRMMDRLGADAACMSTIPEVIYASYLGIRVLGISCITNLASGIASGPLDHTEVTETADRVKEKFTRLVGEIIRRI